MQRKRNGQKHDENLKKTKEKMAGFFTSQPQLFCKKFLAGLFPKSFCGVFEHPIPEKRTKTPLKRRPKKNVRYLPVYTSFSGYLVDRPLVIYGITYVAFNFCSLQRRLRQAGRARQGA
jgi:hypothetical protein